ncbi:putative esterase [Acetobacterium wieringae]|uniref:Putative esterase n=2 Tax=Acetobacterium wieringae TaxID=52694 RepID=A0A1F2PDV9_9FIRM|nr:putative esterase [Acetobacterium wieringae]
MKKMNKIIEIGKRHVTVMADPKATSDSIIYLHMAGAELSDLAVKQAGVDAVLVAIDQVDWNRELSPWPAPRAFKGGADFGGGADAYLTELTETIIPAVEASLGLTPACRVLAGYSLAGLFALYAIYRTDLFTRVGSISGSLWYDGFGDFILKNQPLQIPERAYFSLGDKEKITRNSRLGVVEDQTIAAEQQLCSLGAETIFELNPGNHFDDARGRLARGLQWLV